MSQNPRNPIIRNKKQHKPQWFCHFCGGARHTHPNRFKLQALEEKTKQKVYVPKAQDLMILIHELVKVLNIYANTGAEFKSNSSKNSNSKFASMKVWMQKTQSQ